MTWLGIGCRLRSLSMANPKLIPADVMARKCGVGKLTRHIFLCLGPDCCSNEAGEATWGYLKKRLGELGITGAEGNVYRTKAGCLRMCIDGPLAVVYPEGTWYRRVTIEACERIIQEHLIEGRVVEELCFAIDDLKTKEPPIHIGGS